MSTFETDEPFESTDAETETAAVRGRPEDKDHHDKGLQGGKDGEKHML
jgi:hypothetical protein